MPSTRRHHHHVYGVELDIALREAGHGSGKPENPPEPNDLHHQSA
jgi:hypothetical protein